MIPSFDTDGNLPPGIHFSEWNDFVVKYGTNHHRLQLIAGLYLLCIELRNSGCNFIYIDGSFVTSKDFPNDYDGCWDASGVNLLTLDPILFDFSNARLKQKIKYRGEMFPSGLIEGNSRKPFLTFFQEDVDGNQKGIVSLDLRRIP